MSESYEVPYKELGAMGRAIDAYVLASVRAERDRIIALLESIKPGCECDDCEKPAAEARTYLDHIIALIKGEEQ